MCVETDTLIIRAVEQQIRSLNFHDEKCEIRCINFIEI